MLYYKNIHYKSNLLAAEATLQPNTHLDLTVSKFFQRYLAIDKMIYVDIKANTWNI